MSDPRMITFCGQPMKVDCDRNCAKAWGGSNRPKVQLSDNEDDYEYLADGELGTAPTDPGTSEGCDAKPLSSAEFPNKWCVRECERCASSKMGESELPLALPNLSVRQRNIPAPVPLPIAHTPSPPSPSPTSTGSRA